jgi:hypothetical protein
MLISLVKPKGVGDQSEVHGVEGQEERLKVVLSGTDLEDKQDTHIDRMT